jgi:hypothetical protein
MFKKVQTATGTAIQAMAVLFALFGLANTNQTAAQTTTNNYVITYEVEDICWDYACADQDFGLPSISTTAPTSGCALPGFPLSILGIVDIYLSVPEREGDFVANIGGNVYTASGDLDFPAVVNAGGCMSDFYGTDIQDVIGTQLIASGTAAAAIGTYEFNFEGFENDCGDGSTYDLPIDFANSECPNTVLELSVSSICGLAGLDAITCGALDIAASALGIGSITLYDEPNADEAYYGNTFTAEPVLDAAGNVTGISFDGGAPVALNADGTATFLFEDLAGSDGATWTFTLRANVLALPPTCSTTSLSTGATGGNGYTCLGSDGSDAQTSITISGGTAPYTIYGSGVYQLAGPLFSFPQTQAAAGNFNFAAREDQPWHLVVVDAEGCVDAVEGLFDMPDPQIASEFSSICYDAPIFYIYDEDFYSNPGTPAGDWFVDLGGAVSPGSAVPAQADSHSFLIDPNDLGPGQHTISYCIAPFDPAFTSDYPAILEAQCDNYSCDDMTINIFPSFQDSEGIIGFVLETEYTTCQVPLGGTPGIPLSLGGDDNNDPGVVYLTDAEVASIFAGVEGAFDPLHNITEMDFYVEWQGPGVHDIGVTGNYFSPAEAGLGVHTICVTVGYPDCNQTYCRTVEVVEGFDPSVALSPNFIVCGNVSGESSLTGTAEVPSAASSGTGDVYYTFAGTYNADGDLTGGTLSLNVNYSGISGTPTAARWYYGAGAGANSATYMALAGFPTVQGAFGTYSGTLTLNAAQADAFVAGDSYVNINTAAFPNGEIRGQLNPAAGSLVCSQDEACALTLPAESAPEVLEFTAQGSYNATNPTSNACLANNAPSVNTATATYAIPLEDRPTQFAILNELTVNFRYVGCASPQQGDHNGFFIFGPGGVQILGVTDQNTGIQNDHYPTFTDGGSASNATFDNVTLGGAAPATVTFPTATFNGDTYLQLSMDQILAAYDALTPAEGDGAAQFIERVKCTNPAFTYTLTSGSERWRLDLISEINYTNRYGWMQAQINETTEVLPQGSVFNTAPAFGDGAITFINDWMNGNVYWAYNSRFTTASGNYYDLGAYDEVTVCHLNVGNCATLTGTGADLTNCASEYCLVVQNVSGGNANINNDALCLASFDALHLPTAFFIDGVTTPGGVWTIADANSPDGASNTAGTGVYGEFFNPWMVEAGTYNVCYSLFEAESNPLINCGEPIQGADCATIIVPVHYCVDFANNVVCESCEDSGLVPIIIGTMDVDGNCLPLEDNINIGGEVEETFTACRAEYDNNNSGSTTDVQNQRPTTLDAWDAHGQSNTNAAWQICSDNAATPEKQEGLFTIIENTFSLPAGAQIDDVSFRYNYISTTGTAQGDHDGWGVYFNTMPSCVGSSTYPTNVLTDAAGDPIGYADNQDPDGDNHFPGAYPVTAFEVRDASAAHITSLQNAINTLPASECAIEFTYYYIVASNSQYWDACFNVDVAYHFNPGEEPQTSITAVFHEPLEDGNIVPLYPSWTPTNPIVVQTDAAGNDTYYLNTCNLGGLDEISVIVDIEAALDSDCDGVQTGSCFPMVHSDALVVLESDGFTCGFTTNASPSVCAGNQITITPSGTMTELNFVFQNGVAHPITDENATAAGIQWTVPAGDAGLYHINLTATSPNGCTCTHSEDVLVVAPAVAVTTGGAESFQVCASSLPVDLTQFIGGSSSTGGTFTASTGDVVAGQILMTVSGGSATITYTIDNEISACDASVTFTVTTISEATADFDIIDQICVGSTVNLNSYLTSVSTTGGTFSIGGTALTAAQAAAYTFGNAGLVEIVYSVGSGACADADAQHIYVLNQYSAQAEYGFVCQSETDFTIDLTDYLADGANVMNGGTFNVGGLPPFISEIEYVGGPQANAHDWIEVTGVAGTDLSNYALVFYKRVGYTDNGMWDDDLNSGAVYGWINLSGTIDNEVTASSGVSYGSSAFEYIDYNPANPNAVHHDRDCRGNLITLGTSITGIAEGPAAVALVWVGDQDCTELDNNDVIQYIGYGTRADNTNAGIFTACDGPAATLVSTDINVVDIDVPAAGLNYDGNLFGGDAGVDITAQYSLQFTNGCWVVPSVTDAPVAYATSGPGIADADVDGNGDLSTAGQLNLGLVGDTGAEGNDYGHGGADELYFDYVAPNGDVMHLDRLCHTIFVGGQIVNTAPWVNPENGLQGGINDGDVVRFECQTQTYTIPFTYQILGNGSTTCSSDAAAFFLTVLMDYEENWNGSAPGSADPAVHEAGDHGYEVLKEGVCDYSETNLNQYIDDVVHFIPPMHFEGSYDTTATFTFEENVKNPDFTELHYSHYGYPGTAADDHCVVYNFIDDNNTPFDNTDDSFDSWNFCEGIEISAEVGSELSCYGLVFYTNNSPNGRGLATDVTYIGVDGMPHTTDVANGIYMQLYGRVDEDPSDWSLPNGTILSVPVDNGEADAWGHLPWYGGAGASGNGNGPTAGDNGSVDNPVRHSGLYVDVNSNERYDASDIPVPSAVSGVASDAATFPWERGNECPKPNAGSRWFPILDVPGGAGEVAGVGLLNQCNGELVKYISWGGQICNEDKEGFTLAGPFEQLTSTPIDTTQQASATLGDMRTLQLVSCSDLFTVTVSGSTADTTYLCPNGEQRWVLSYNGGAFTIPGTNGVEVEGSEELYEFSNSIGYYNCNMNVNDVVAQPESFVLDLSDVTNEDMPDHFVITGHTIEVTIGSVDNNYSQLYTYQIGAGACEVPGNSIDLAESTNTNVPNVVPGQYCGGDFDGDITNTNPAMDVDINPTDGIYDFLTHPFSGFATNDAWAAGNTPSPVYMGSTVDGYGYPAENGSNDSDSHCLGCTSDPNYCHDDLEFAPDQDNWSWTTFNGAAVNQYQLQNPSHQAAVNGQLDFQFDNGVGELNPDGACYVGYCAHLAKTTYTVSDLRALLYNGNIYGTYEDGSLDDDTCRVLTPDVDDVRVTIRVRVTYEQCLPVGHFAGTDVSLNTDNLQQPYWVFAPNGLSDISPIAITYDVTNAHEIETDDANDDLACLDDDNDNIRTQFIDVLGGAQASLSQSAVTLCSANIPANLNAYVSGGAGTWSGNGVNAGGTFTATAAGTYNVVLTAGSGTCSSTAGLTVTVETSGSVNTSGIPTTVCAGTVVNLPAASWSASAGGGAVVGNTWTAPMTPTTATLSYSAGSGSCGATGSVNVVVQAPISVSESFDADACSVTLTVSGGAGAGTYQFNGMGFAGNSTVVSVDGMSMLSGSVTSAGSVCGAFSYSGGPFSCTPSCVPNAYGLQVSGGGSLCGNGSINATAGFGDNNLHVYALTNAAGDIVMTSASGTFDLVNAAGDFNVWAVGYCSGTVLAGDAAGLAAQVTAGLIDLEGPIAVTVSPAIQITGSAGLGSTPDVVCDPATGYSIIFRAFGGDVEVNGQGSYNPSIEAVLIDNAGATAPLMGNGSTFQIPGPLTPGAVVTFSVGDGSLCNTSISVAIPADACGIAAGNDNGNTLVDQSVVIDVLGNDVGSDLEITGFTQPANGTVTMDANGNFVYTPNEGFVGTDLFTYEATDMVGQTDVASVFVTVAGSGALAATDTRDCSGAAVSGFSVITIAVSGGTAPYTFTGSYSGTLNNVGSVQFNLAEGSGYYVEVSDATGATQIIDESNALPCTKVSVELLAFDGVVKEEGNLLKWITASEINNDYFTLEYSANGADFERIATIEGNGTTSTANSYDFLHTNAPAGISYYRLSTVDFDGKVVIEGIVTLVRGDLGFTFVNIRPVPATSVLNVEFNNTVNGNVSIEVYNTVGQLVSRQAMTATNGINEAQIEVANFATGTYFLTINNGAEVRVTKFIKD